MKTYKRSKKVRSIIVDGEEYLWKVGDWNCDGDYSCKFKIWYKGELVFQELTTKNITPKDVESAIKDMQLHYGV